MSDIFGQCARWVGLNRRQLSPLLLLVAVVFIVIATSTTTPSARGVLNVSQTLVAVNGTDDALPPSTVSSTKSGSGAPMSLKPVSKRAVSTPVLGAVLRVEPLLPTSLQAAELLGPQAAISVDGPVGLPSGANAAVWLRGWRTTQVDVLIWVATFESPQKAALWVPKLVPTGMVAYGPTDRAPRPWVLPSADDLRVVATSNGAIVVARVGASVVSATVVLLSPQRLSPVPQASAFVARVLHHLPNGALLRPSGHQPSLIVQQGTLELLPKWLQVVPTRNMVFPVIAERASCVTFDEGTHLWASLRCLDQQHVGVARVRTGSLQPPLTAHTGA